MEAKEPIIDFWQATEDFKIGHVLVNNGTIITIIDNIAYIPVPWFDILTLPTNDRLYMKICQSCTSLLIR